MTRFDIPDTVKAVLIGAIETGLADAADIFALGVTHGDDFDAMVNEIVEWAFTLIHTDSDIHAKISRLVDAYYFEKIAA